MSASPSIKHLLLFQHAFAESTYSSLCSLCSSQSCTEQPSTDPFLESLQCLTNNDADVAFTALDKAEEFFKNPENLQKYKYLCKDDSTSAPETPCVWSKQLRTLIVANRFEPAVSCKVFLLTVCLQWNCQLCAEYFGTVASPLHSWRDYSVWYFRKRLPEFASECFAAAGECG